MPFDPHIPPEDARLALIAATILRTLATREHEKINYPSPDAMISMANKLTDLADLYDRG